MGPMAKIKFDGVVEAVHYEPTGNIKWARAYIRHGSVFTDRVILDREKIISDLRDGKRFYIGTRVKSMGGVFQVTEPLRFLEDDNKTVISTTEEITDHDHLIDVPVF
jgi:hypothetical protein